MILDKTNIVPLYYQIADIFRVKILNGSFKSGDMIPPETTLMRQYYISRGTVRQVMGILIQDGLVERYPGKGSFVSHSKIEHDANRYLGLFSQVMIRAGKTPSAKIIEAKEIIPPDIVKAEMKNKVGDKVVIIKRLRFVDNEPFAIETQYFRMEIGRKLLKEDLHGSIYKILTTKYGYVLKRSKITIEASLASEENARLLGKNKISPVSLVRRSMYSADEKIIEYSIDIYIGDKNRFIIENTYITEKITFGIEA